MKKRPKKNPEDRHPFFDQMEQLWRNKTAVAGMIIVTVFVITAILAPWISPHDPVDASLYDQLKPPLWQGGTIKNILGTDDLGRDIWTRLIYGARIILVYLPVGSDYFFPGGTALWSVFAALVVGCALGLVGGYYGGWLDDIIMRLLDAMMSIPVLLLYLIIVAALGASAVNVVLAIAIVGSPGIARLARGLTLDLRTREYVWAAKARAERPWRIMFLEILPNARGPIIVDAMLRIGQAVFAMGTLGFLGLGIPPPSPDWGSMIASGRLFILKGSPWAALWPSLAIASLVVGFNLIADGLREESNRYQ